MKELILFLSFILFSIGMWGTTATMTGLTNASTCTVNSKSGIKVGTNSSGGSMKVTVGTNATTLDIYIAAWNGESPTITITPSNKVGITTITPTSDSGVKNNSPFTLNEDEETYHYTITLSNITETTDITFTGSSTNNKRRFVVWGAEYSSSSYTITAQSNNNTYGTVSLDGNVITGSPAEGYRYATPSYTVTSGTATVSQSGNKFTVTPSTNTTITINFEPIPSHTLSSSVTPIGGGSVALSSTSVLEGLTATATATPSDGYAFAGWSIAGTGSSLSSASTNPTTITMGTDNATITATFIESPAPPEPGENTLFHETFGNNPNKVKDWSDSCSHKSGILSVYEDAEYTISNAGQSKNNVGYILSGLFQRVQGTDAYIIIGPLNVEDYNNLTLTYQWNAASIKETYSTSLYYSTSSSGVYTEVSGTGNGATSFIERVYNLPEDAQVSTLYLKIIWNTSNAYAVIDEVNLSGTDCSDEYTIVWKNNGKIYASGNPPTIFNPCVGIDKIPNIPNTSPICSEEFIGWSESEMTGDGNDEPTDLFNTITEFNGLYKNVDGDRCFHATFASISNPTPINKNSVTTFTSEQWRDNNNSWIDIQSGYDFDAIKGVHITLGTTGASALSKYLYRNISSINVECTNSSGSIDIQIGQNDVSTMDMDTGTLTFNYSPAQTGQVQLTVNCTAGVYVKSVTINYLEYEYKDYITYCTDTLKSGTSWSSGTWSLSRAPQSNERAVVLSPVTVDIKHARAKEVILGPSGQITIEANKGLEVEDTISIHNGTYSATTPDKLVLNSSGDGNASLIFNNNNESQATVALYSVASIDRVNNKWNWQYIGTPMTSVNALYNYYDSWLYEWVESDGWTAVPNGGTMYPWRGYCITQESPEWYGPTGTLIPTDDIENLTLTVPARKDMVFANSWTAPIHISKMSESGFVMNPMNVYLFNTGSAPTGSTEGTEAGTHVVIPIHAAPYVKDTLIAPQQGFFVSNKNGASEGSIVLNYKKLVRGSDSIVAGPMHAPRRSPMADDKPDVLKIYANGSQYRDNVVILAREDFSTEFDNGWDGEKSSFGTLSPSIYVVNNDGSYDAVSAIPDYEGTLLGFMSGTDSVYSLTFEYDGEETLYLNDMLMQESTFIGNESTYVFMPSESDDIRFAISATPYYSVSTNIDDSNVDSNTPHKFLHNGNLYIFKNNCIFNMAGSLIRQ